ncbi:hypothetical protein ANN_19146 [Periplaneta americana]|uniref:CCHC-type domain-containing protein n=1 Tax=Periplaneta americana TaxID=6978 RepID=A0ABQ8S920_PERAM|nr:hypothetical protein ANN_19146 [Periplaneta americana]
MEFLGEEVDSALTTQKIRGDALSSTYIPTTATLRVDSKTGSRSRKSRSRGHWAQDCKVVPDASERVKRLKNANRCFLCLNRGHSARDCSRKGKALCTHCKMSHHRSICSNPRSTEPTTHPTKFTSVNRINAEATDFTYLQTARVWVMGPTRLTKLTCCVLDGWSQSSFVTKSIVDELKLEVVDWRDLVIASFETSSTSSPRRLVRFSVKSIWTNSTASVTGFESTHVFSPQPAVPHDVKMLAHTRKLQLADPKDHTEDMTLPIEIIIGSDHYWKKILGSGDLEIRENQDRQRSSKDSAILQAFEDSYLIEDQRRVVSLPRKEGIIPPTNRYNAQRWFHNLEKRLQGNAHLKEIYYTQMMDYIVKGHVDLVALGSQPYDEFYLPHQLVKKEKRGGDDPSLNDSLEMGPNLLPEVLSILLRFRTYRTAIIGNIEQAILQLKLDRKDRFDQVFWYNVTQDDEGKYEMTSDVTIYRFTRLPFGLTCSPFLLSAALRELAYLHKSTFPSAASLIDNSTSTFMDDFVASRENDNQVISLYYELTQLMNIFSLPMVLGGMWDTSSDTFYIDHRDITETFLEGPTRKRQLLRVTSRFYDILGLLTPISITGKLLFQDTWCRGMEWDELLPHDLGTRWHMWISSLSELSQIRIPRWIGTSERYIHQLHVFCDASERAYGAVIYVRSTKDDCVSVSLACSKNRLAPVKKVTLPRLELQAALVGA